VTSHASQGVTVDKVFIGASSQSIPATYQRTAYVAVTRGREQAMIFTDDRKELLRAFGRTDDPLSATEISGATQPRVRNWLKKQLESVQGPAISGQRRDFMQPGVPRSGMAEREPDHAR
jgi:hypothetical protein